MALNTPSSGPQKDRGPISDAIIKYVKRGVPCMTGNVAAAVVSVISGCWEMPPAGPSSFDSKFYTAAEQSQCFIEASSDNADDNANPEVPPKYIPLRIYRMISPEGSPDQLSKFQLDKLISEINKYFESSKTIFYAANIEDLQLDRNYTIEELHEDSELTGTLSSQVPGDKIRIFILDDAQEIFDEPNSTIGFWSHLEGAVFIQRTASRTDFAHELGHAMGLLHPHEQHPICPDNLTDDCIRDTPPDSWPEPADYTGCSFSEDSCLYECADGTHRDPLNLMGYHLGPGEGYVCQKHFSPDQNQFIQCMVETSGIGRFATVEPDDPDAI